MRFTESPNGVFTIDTKILKKILKIFEDQNKFQIWLILEILASSAMEQWSNSKGTTLKLKKAKFSRKWTNWKENEAWCFFLTNVAKYVGQSLDLFTKVWLLVIF